jgi:putative transposase
VASSARSECVAEQSHALEVHRYVALNPVRAGLVDDPDEWPWSSLGATLGREPASSFLDVDGVLAEFGPNRETARRRLRLFVRDGLRRDGA